MGAGPHDSRSSNSTIHLREEATLTTEAKITEGTVPARPANRIERRSALLLGAAAASTLVAGMARPAEAAAAHKVKITVLYSQPKSPEAFEKYYAETHLPIARKMKGVSRIELSKVAQAPGEPAPAFYRIAELYFSSKAQMDKVMATPAAKNTVADLPNFATGGFTVLVSEIA
jgi:uncharacterized protein (TIGR02118 family)